MADKSPQAFRTIREVADWLGVEAHVLRFWESKFSQIKPVKRAGGRRYYRPADMRLIGGIKVLLHDQGMTTRGVQKILREEGVPHVSALSLPLEEELSATSQGGEAIEAIATVEPETVSAPPPQATEPGPERNTPEAHMTAEEDASIEASEPSEDSGLAGIAPEDDLETHADKSGEPGFISWIASSRRAAACNDCSTTCSSSPGSATRRHGRCT